MQGADSARESLPRVGGGAERSEAEGLLETIESLIKLGSWQFFCHIILDIFAALNMTEKLSRTRNLAADFSVSNSPSTAYGGPPPLTQGRHTRPLLR